MQIQSTRRGLLRMLQKSSGTQHVGSENVERHQVTNGNRCANMDFLNIPRPPPSFHYLPATPRYSRMYLLIILSVYVFARFCEMSKYPDGGWLPERRRSDIRELWTDRAQSSRRVRRCRGESINNAKHARVDVDR